MRHTRPAFFLLIVGAISSPAEARGRDPLCAPMKAFVASVEEGQEQSIVFRTHWGGGFSDEAEDGEVIFAAKRCDADSDHAPAATACRALMEEGAIEFADSNFRRIVTCLSPKSKFAAGISIHHAGYRFTVGDEEVGAFVTIEFAPDEKIGGMAMRILTSGY
jgi:hypothetical protein